VPVDRPVSANIVNAARTISNSATRSSLYLRSRLPSTTTRTMFGSGTAIFLRDVGVSFGAGGASLRMATAWSALNRRVGFRAGIGSMRRRAWGATGAGVERPGVRRAGPLSGF
jgi:hypothetical protein